DDSGSEKRRARHRPVRGALHLVPACIQPARDRQGAWRRCRPGRARSRRRCEASGQGPGARCCGASGCVRLGDAGGDPGQRRWDRMALARPRCGCRIRRRVRGGSARKLSASGRRCPRGRWQAGAGDDRNGRGGDRGRGDCSRDCGPDRGDQRPARRPAAAAQCQPRADRRRSAADRACRARRRRPGVRRRVQPADRCRGLRRRVPSRPDVWLRRQEPDPSRPDYAVPPDLRRFRARSATRTQAGRGVRRGRRTLRGRNDRADACRSGQAGAWAGWRL
ncbi:MAG: Malyl-CoA lyase, partial [uncultured Sphingomonas sp.]